MPLPEPGAPWPPPGQAAALSKMTTWSAWWAGDPAQLHAVYGGSTSTTDGNFGLPQDRPSQSRGGVVGAVSRMFWGKPRGSRDRSKLHVPLPADMASISAGLLFADPPKFTPPEGASDAVGKRLDKILNTPRTHAKLTEGAEIQAALGGTWLRVVVDETAADHAMLDVVDADHAFGEWRWGKLTAATFVTVLPSPEGDTTVWRHLERHEMTGTGASARSVILHGLYAGDTKSLGRSMPFDARPETEWLMAEAMSGRLTEQGIVTAATSLTAAYVPNMRPAREWRAHPALCDLGQSDFAGIEGLFDWLDEIWSSMQREVRLGKARATIPQGMLTNLGPGSGLAWDEDREYYTALKTAPSSEDPSMANSIVTSQPDIRDAALLALAKAAGVEAVRGAGYSPITFGFPDEVAATATEVNARERASHRTRGVKLAYWDAELGPLLRALLDVDAERFGSGAAVSDDVKAEWPPPAADPMSVRATTVDLLKRAESASTATRVEILHPEWDDPRVEEEVALIQAETGAAVPDPFAAGEDGGDAPEPGPDGQPHPGNPQPPR